MNCLEVNELLSMWVDGEASSSDSIAIEHHLSECDECKATADSVRTLDKSMKSAFASDRMRGNFVANAAIQELEKSSDQTNLDSKPWFGRFSSVVIATAAGFLIAVLIFQPWKPPRKVIIEKFIEIEPDNSKPPIFTPPVARLINSIGEIEFRSPKSNRWQAVSGDETLAYSKDTSIRTSNDVKCELITSDDCVLRLDGGTEVTFKSGSQVEIARGQMWCRASNDVPFEVNVVDAATKNSIPYAICSRDSSAILQVNADSSGHVIAATEGIKVMTVTGSEVELESDEIAIVEMGKVNKKRYRDAILAGSWMHPLIIKKELGDQDVDSRVDQLLARIGAAKLATLYEQEIRSLGEHCVLPLLRFVQSDESRQNLAQRKAAMRIVSDLAPGWAVEDLIALLKDSEPNIRYYSAVGLKRLTSLTHGRTPDGWKNPWVECRDSHERWHTWWNDHKAKFPARPKAQTWKTETQGQLQPL